MHYTKIDNKLNFQMDKILKDKEQYSGHYGYYGHKS